MDTESSPALNCWNVPQDEREQDLLQLLEEEDGGQPAAPFGLGPLTYMNENLLSEEDLKELLEEEGDGGQSADPLGNPAPAAMLPGRDGEINILKWGCKGARGGPRKRGTYSQDKSCLRDGSSAREGRRPTWHWKREEVNRLIAGVEKYGQSEWSKIKRGYFPDSDQTPGDLKNKWRNLRKACKRNAQRRGDKIPNNDQIERIQMILNDSELVSKTLSDE